MPILINDTAQTSKGAGDKKMLGTTPSSEFDRYKQRVLADGGQIKDDARTLKAFELLFESKVYGNITTFVSGTFGVKTDSNNHILKAYAIDGHDLVSLAVNGGELPKLTASREFDFSSNDVSGMMKPAGILTTETAVKLSKTNKCSLLINSSKPTSSGQAVVGLSYNNTIRHHFNIMGLVFDGRQIIPKLTFVAQKNPMNPNSSLNAGRPVSFNAQKNKMIGVHIDAVKNERTFLSDGIQGQTDVEDMWDNISGTELYINLGSMYLTQYMKNDNGIVKDFIFAGNVSKEQAAELTTFV